MSRNEGRIEASGEGAVDAAEILVELAREGKLRTRRQDAVRCYLSASEGWQKASTVLGGAFASAEAEDCGQEDE